MTRLLIIIMLGVVPSCDADNKDKSAADNTRQNERDRDDANKTPGDQLENRTDIDITASVRRAVVGDDALSMNAKNVKIISESGVVTLRGPVKSEAERDAIARYAQNTSGVQRVDNQLELTAE